jgi:hypothetical protein
MSFLNNAIVCLARVPVNVLQVSVRKQFYEIAASILYEDKNEKKTEV